MAQLTILDALQTEKAIFWQENSNLSEHERQRFWDLRWKYFGSQVGVTSPKTNTHGSTLPQKRSVPRTMSVGGPRPSKRAALVGLPCLRPLPVFPGLTLVPEPRSPGLLRAPEDCLSTCCLSHAQKALLRSNETLVNSMACYDIIFESLPSISSATRAVTQLYSRGSGPFAGRIYFTVTGGIATATQLRPHTLPSA